MKSIMYFTFLTIAITVVLMPDAVSAITAEEMINQHLQEVEQRRLSEEELKLEYESEADTDATEIAVEQIKETLESDIDIQKEDEYISDTQDEIIKDGLKTDTEEPIDVVIDAEEASKELTEELADSKEVQKDDKLDMLEPLLSRGPFSSDGVADVQQAVRLEGRLVPEKQPVARRKNFIRWVLVKDDFSRIPVKSTLDFLTAIRRDGILDSRVQISGTRNISFFNPDLHYLTITSVRAVDDEDALVQPYKEPEEEKEVFSLRNFIR